jgi:hypothetical protein
MNMSKFTPSSSDISLDKDTPNKSSYASIYLSRHLKKDDSDEIIFESINNSEQAVTLSLEELTIEPHKYQGEKNPSVYKLLANKRAQLVIFTGNVEWLSVNDQKQFSFDEDSKKAFIFWRVSEPSIIGQLQNNLNRNKMIHVSITLACNDDVLSSIKVGSTYTIDIDKISVTFS